MKRSFWMPLIRKRAFQKREIIAFLHIPKTAGTTLTQLFRNNFFLRFCSVANLNTGINWALTAEQLDLVLTINPLIKCISGHTVRPFGNIIEKYSNIRFLTILRDPVSRYISQYLYNLEILKDNLKNFDDFLSRESEHNMQTKRIAGSEDLDRAIQILKTHFFLVGITEEFDGFLLLLNKKLKSIKFDLCYQKKNVSQQSLARATLLEEMDNYSDRIMEANYLDMQLYDYVKNELWKNEKEAYGSSYGSDLKKSQSLNRKSIKYLFQYPDYLLRKCYYDPILRLLGRKSGFTPRTASTLQ